MSDLFAMKGVDGELYRSSARSVRVEVVEDFVMDLIQRGLVVDRPEWSGLAFFWRYWRLLRRHGYSVVRVSVSMFHDHDHGWHIPELTEVGA